MVSHYRIIEKIGAGGMGEVYLAEDTKLNRRVALKFLPTHQAGDSDTRARFTREAQSAAKLNHPNIVTVHEVGESEGRPFIAMEYISGKPLTHYCRVGKLTIGEMIALAIQVCDGLSKAHQMGIVHRDIKPANVVIDSDSRAKILDFGLAAVQGAETITKTGSTLGTMAYMSPEQAQGKEIDQRSDLFSFGVVLYELITGQTLFKRDNYPATLQAIVNDNPEPLARYRSNVPDELQRIVTKLLERDPGLRYQTASDVIADLKKLAISGSLLVNRPVGIKPSRLWVYVGAIGVILGMSAIFLLIRAGKGVDSLMPEMTITPITNDGNVTTAAISRDGNYIGYTTADGGRQGIWIQHMASGGKVQIVDTSDVTLVDLCFAPDGNALFYRLLTVGDRGDLYQVPVLGGRPHKVVSDVWGKVTFSPTGDRIAFWRVMVPTMNRAVVTALADGSGEGALTEHMEGAEQFFSNEPAWSPDGKVIAITRGTPNGSTLTLLAMLDATTGKELSEISGNWVSKLSLSWLPVGGVIVAATHRTNPFGQQIWRVSYPEGKLRRITNDLNSYSEVSLTADGKRLAVLQTDKRAAVWLVPLQNPHLAKQILNGKFDGLGGLSWADSNSMVFFTRTANDYCLARYFLDWGKQEIVTRGNPIVLWPSVSQKRHTMVYFDASDQNSGISVSDLDGRNRKNLTDSGEYGWPNISSDGNWVVYCKFSNGYPRVLKAPIDGGAGRYLDSDTSAAQLVPRISPDGRWVACFYVDLRKQRFQLAVLSAEGGSPVYLFDVPQSLEHLELVWSTDGSSILYLQSKSGVSNVWSQSIAGGNPRQITFFSDQIIESFDLSPDGKNLAVCRSKSTSDVVLIEGFR